MRGNLENNQSNIVMTTTSISCLKGKYPEGISCLKGYGLYHKSLEPLKPLEKDDNGCT